MANTEAVLRSLSVPASRLPDLRGRGVLPPLRIQPPRPAGPPPAAAGHPGRSTAAKFVDANRFLGPSEDMYQEKKALYKLISGLHSSISVHIAYCGYILDESANLVSTHYRTTSCS
ncbi:hypothetical protein BRADI_4g11936v3 [Brachypodium distachyon]|uniref:Uncharacterized protein n=1 Tax=Brachypodium distachyon TaxID=15368 RepID=A0A2K2CM91_BRADI|nr:hypothetical protein BRADI_4g11936v3 [Brachypodium distachyon]